jgi:hypothetical protein
MDYTNDLKTGDLILFNSHPNGLFSILSNMIRLTTHSNYTHIGFILKDPTFIEPHLKGLYVWESGWEGMPDPQDNEIKLGVQITPFEEIINNSKGAEISIRQVNCPLTLFNEEKLKEIHTVVYKKPYDILPKDWLPALFRKDLHPQKTDRFWCSALVGYIYTKLGLLVKETDWSILRPCDFSIMDEYIKFNEGCSLSKEEIKLR